MTRVVAVVGAGAAGLAAALDLAQAGHDVEVHEARSQVGGMIASDRKQGFLLERGPNSVRLDAPFRAWIEDLGLADRILPANPNSRRRYVVNAGRLVPLPAGPSGLATTPLLSARGRLRLLAEPLIGRGGRGDETIARFVERRLGREVLENFVDPFVSGVYAGDPDRLSARSTLGPLVGWERECGSLLLGGLRTLGRRRPADGPRGIVSFPEGLGELPRRMADRLGSRLRCSSRVSAIAADPAGGYRLEGADGPDRRLDGVVVAVEAPEAHRLCRPIDPPGALSAIAHAPIASVFLGFESGDVGHPLDGFGYLAPGREGRSVLGVLFSSSLFPGRAPAGQVALTAFVGGIRRPHLVEAEDGPLLEQTLSDLGPLLGIDRDPTFARITRWRTGIPQYEPGHEGRVDELDRFESRHPGLVLAGNYRDGVSVSAALAAGRESAIRLVRTLDGL